MAGTSADDDDDEDDEFIEWMSCADWQNWHAVNGNTAICKMLHSHTQTHTHVCGCGAPKSILCYGYTLLSTLWAGRQAELLNELKRVRAICGLYQLMYEHKYVYICVYVCQVNTSVPTGM